MARDRRGRRPGRPPLPRPVPYDDELVAARAEAQLATGRKVAQPRSMADWQFAADAAMALLAFESARAFGLISGGPDVNADRCSRLLSQADARHGIRPSTAGVAAMTDAVVAAYSRSA